MPKWATIALLCVGALLLLRFAANLAMESFMDRSMSTLEEATSLVGADGKNVGTSGTLEDCLEAMVMRSGRCTTEMACAMMLSTFLWGCIDAAPYDAAFCAAVPGIENDEAVKRWGMQACARYGRPDDQTCVFSASVFSAFCSHEKSAV